MTHAKWWYTEGSGMRPLPNEDIEEFAKRITEIAWSNGAYKEREACAKVCEQTDDGTPYNLAEACAKAIRTRGQE
jgi:hypothetical protein